MRTLLLCSRPPWPLSGGDRIRTWHLARQLSLLGPVDLVAMRAEDEEEAAIREGLPFVENFELPVLRRRDAVVGVGRSLLNGRSLQTGLYASASARQRVQKLLTEHAYSLIVAHLVRTVSWLPEQGPPVLVDIQDALSAQYEASRGHRKGWRGLAMALEQERIRREEEAAVARADGLSFISREDASKVPTGSKPVGILGAAVDFDRLVPQGSAPIPGRIGFLGNLRTASNRDMVVYFAQAVLPKLRARHPATEFHIFGHEAGREIASLSREPGVFVVGSIRDQMPALESCWLTVCPLRFGSGVQNKILESLAAGTPVVASGAAVEALQAPGKNAPPVVRADLGADFVDAVGTLLSDADKRDSLSVLGRSWVHENHSPEAAFAPLGELLAALV